MGPTKNTKSHTKSGRATAINPNGTINILIDGAPSEIPNVVNNTGKPIEMGDRVTVKYQGDVVTTSSAQIIANSKNPHNIV